MTGDRSVNMAYMAKKKSPTVMAGTRLEPDVHAIVVALSEQEDRKIAQMIAILVKEALAARGLYKRKPPPSAAKPKD
jgi:hypothetical protein